MNENRLSTGIEGLDRTLDYLRPGDTVTWQIESIGDYIYAATQFFTGAARTGRRIVYLRFGDHVEILDEDALSARSANIRKYTLDPSVGFETFAVQVHRIIDAEPEDTIFLSDCISDLQRYWFSDLMVCNYFCLTSDFVKKRGCLFYTAIRYQRHIYETASRIRNASPVLINIRTLRGRVYVHPVKAEARYSDSMYFPLEIEGGSSRVITSSAESFAIFDIFTQTGERRDCWDRMFDSVIDGCGEPTDEDGVALKENILKCLLGTEPTRLELCRKYFTIRDLISIKRREIGTGCIGGKAVGMLLARNILRREEPEIYDSVLEPHDSYFIGADVFYTYAVQNGTWDLRTRMIEPEDYIRIAPAFREKLLQGSFMPTIKEQFMSMLEYFGQSPIIVRSSSILEDGIGNAFAGKYESVFCPNQGSLEERYRVFEDAVRTVYASTVSPEAIQYRAERNLLNRDEQMALLVMRVSGDRHGELYFPHMAGVGHSQNLYVRKVSMAENNQGMLRLVFGLGTRAVNREADDYARFIELDNPLAPPAVEYGEEYRYSQHHVDLIDLKNNCFRSEDAEKIDRRMPGLDTRLFWEPDYAAIARYRELEIYGEQPPEILNFNRLIRQTDFAEVMRRIMKSLEAGYHYPVDVEYACNFKRDGSYRVNLLQCRTIQTKGLGKAGVMPKVQAFLFRVRGNFMGGNVCIPIRYAVFVKIEAYLDLTEQRRYSVARRLGEIGARLKGTRSILIGPGRWGTSTTSLGVPVNFAEISHYSCICELDYKSHGLSPELSYGSHFFQDLVESGIFYTAVYPEKEDLFREELFERYPDRYEELTGDTQLADVISVYDFGARGAILYSEIAAQDCFLGIL